MIGTVCTEYVPLLDDGNKVSLRNVLLSNEPGTMLMFHMHVSLARHFRRHLSFSVNNNVEVLTRKYLIR
jgi:hypothetical protein